MKKLIIAMLAAASMFYGCSAIRPYCKQTTGTSIVVGISPISGDSPVSIDVLSYLSGNKFTCYGKAHVKTSYTNVASNSYFGVVHNVETKQFDVDITPVDTNEFDNCMSPATNKVSIVK